MSHDNNFDVLRLVAALFVVTSHAFQMTGNHDTEALIALSNGTIAISTIGLYMFFFTSGFLVTQSAVASDNAKHFLFKRFLRIFPALIVVVLISVFIAGPILTRLSTTEYFEHPRTWGYLQNLVGRGKYLHLPGVFQGPKFYMNDFNGPLWTIGLELKLYFFLAILLALGWIHNKNLHLLICTGLILVVMGIWILRHNGHLTVWFPRQREVPQIVAFCLGSMVAVSKPSAALLKITGAVAGVVFLLRFAGVVPDIKIDEIVFFSIATYFLAFTKKFRVSIANDISYGAYLVSMPVQSICYMLSGFNSNPWLNILLCIVPTVSIAWLSWKYIEQPSLQLKHLYRSRPQLA